MYSLTHSWWQRNRKTDFGVMKYCNSVGLYLCFFKLSIYILIPTRGLFHVCTGYWNGKKDYQMWRLYFLVIGIEILWNERNMYL